MDKEKGKKKLNAYIRFSAMGFQMLAIVLITAFAGNYIDKHWLPTKYPVFTIVLILCGLAISMYLLIQQLKAVEEDNTTVK